MRYFMMIFMVFFVFGITTIGAQENLSYMAVLELNQGTDLDWFESIEIPIYYQYQNSLIVGLSSTQITNLTEMKVTFRIIDSQLFSEEYFIITSWNENYINLKENWGKIIYQDSEVIILKTDSLPVGDIVAAGFEIARLSAHPHYLKNEKVYLSSSENVPDFEDLNDVLQEINVDSVRWFIQSLQDFGTRFLLATNRDSVAEWIKNQFLRLGIADVQIDSFQYSGTWQKNVIATLPGLIHPDKVYIVGGHHDSYSSGSPMVYAPGADDNASGTSATLEIARAIMSSGYQPEATIKFITFAAEEYGLHGSHDYAQKAQAAGMDIGLMINHDMISYSTGSPGNWRVSFNYYTGYEHYLAIAYQILQSHTTLLGANGTVNASFSDSYSFWSHGFPAFYFEEYNFSPYYHSPNDVISNYNMDFCTEVIKASAALLIITSATPAMVEGLEISDNGDGQSLLLNWLPNSEPDMGHYNIHVGQSSGVYDTMYTSSQTLYDLTGLQEGITYFVGVSAVDTFGNEGFIVEKTGIPFSVPQRPVSFRDVPQMGEIMLVWRANQERDLWGYDVYRSLTSGGTAVKLNGSILIDTVYSDQTPQSGQYYFYTVKAVDSMQNESEASEEIRSRAVSLDGGILLVDETADGDGSLFNPTDTEVDSFYAGLSEGFQVTAYDLEAEAGIKLADLGAFSTVIWYGDDFTEFAVTEQIKQSLKEYLDFGGNLLVSSYHPSTAFASVSSYPANFSSGEFIYDYLKISQTEFTAPARFKGALPLTAGYDSVFVDPDKTSATLAYHLLKVESIHAAAAASNIYAYDTDYDVSTSMGALKAKPVAVEYLGNDFKTVVLSFPLYYQNFQEAKNLVQYILTNKFDEIMSITDLQTVKPESFILEQNFPNPFNPVTTIAYQLPVESAVKLTLFDLNGRKIAELVNQSQAAGYYRVKFNGNGLASGIYIYRLEAGDRVQSRKMVLMK
ncbi:MAG: M20/M25/M40 family metallo-hydrolase [bacterium]|nr:MAG: M20/M25/M40 family metallo-hydrolase [bacterium]